MTRYFDGMGNELTNWVESLKAENEALKLENLKLKQLQHIKPDAIEGTNKRRKTT